MRLDLAIGLRYMGSRRREGGIAFVSGVAVLGVALGVAALVVAMAVMNGYQANLLRAMAGSLPHVSLHPLSGQGFTDPAALQDLINRTVHPLSVSPYLTHETLVRKTGAPSAPLQGVMVRGIDPTIEQRQDTFLAFLDDGAADFRTLPPAARQERARRLLDALAADPDSGAAPVLLSRALAAKLQVGLGDALSPLEFSGGGGFSPQPLAARLVVRGYFETGILAFDELMLIADLARLQRVMPTDRSDFSLGVRIQDPLGASRAADALRDAAPVDGNGYHVYSWLESNKGLFQVIQIQKVMLFLVLMLIVVIAFFGMISALVMLVVEKTREITILKALGIGEGWIHRIFLVQGLMIGVVGAGLGLALGLGICWVLQTFPLISIPAGVYPGSDRVPVQVAASDLLWVLAGTMAVCLAATQFPSRKAMSIRPVDGLRRA